MNNIPQDVMKQARAAWLEVLEHPERLDSAVSVIARAIMAAKAEERERCAKVAHKIANKCLSLDEKNGAMLACTTIRKGEPHDKG